MVHIIENRAGKSMIKMGIDVGGTFTDLVVIDDRDGRINLTKVPSTPKSPDQAVLNGIEKVSQLFAIDPREIDFLMHGTTVATNAIIERKGVDTAVVVTQGFRDVLHIARQVRPKLYNFFERRPDPLVPRHLRFEVPERILHTSEVLCSLDEDAMRRVAKQIGDLRIQVVAVCFLHSYTNPCHEELAREILQETIPGVKVCISSDILPEYKEYERASTTVINAYVMPIVEAYLQRIATRLKEKRVRSALHIMQSNGGLMTSVAAGQKSVHTVLSGPAAGVLGGVAMCKMLGEDNIITIDMGGTSFDVSLACNGEPTFTSESEIDGHIIKVPMLDIKTLGAGGGSIAWVDAGGALQVGPQSAGADPGPACYGRAGRQPTVTDANLVLGYLNPNYFAGGEMGLDVELARTAIEEQIAQPMAMETEVAAEGILTVVNATMIRGIRLVSVERGHDPRGFALVCFGGAGPVHAVRLAKDLNISKVIVPEAPGVNCAMGLLMADFRHDHSRTFLHRLHNLDPQRLTEAFSELEARATAQMMQDGLRENEIVFQRSGDLRYIGQGYELEVPFPRRADAAETDLRSICELFSHIHEENYGYRMSDDAVEAVNLRLTSVGILSKPKITEERPAGDDPSSALKEHRTVFMDGTFLKVPVYDRSKLRRGNRLDSPAIIEQLDSTTVVFAGYHAEVDRYRNLVITQ